jgi:hypothetical protein
MLASLSGTGCTSALFIVRLNARRIRRCTAGGGSNPVLQLRFDWYLASVQVIRPFQNGASYFFRMWGNARLQAAMRICLNQGPRLPPLRRPPSKIGILLVTPARKDGGAASRNACRSGGCGPRKLASDTDALEARRPCEKTGAHHAVRFLSSHRSPAGGAVRSGLKLP